MSCLFGGLFLWARRGQRDRAAVLVLHFNSLVCSIDVFARAQQTGGVNRRPFHSTPRSAAAPIESVFLFLEGQLSTNEETHFRNLLFCHSKTTTKHKRADREKLRPPALHFLGTLATETTGARSCHSTQLSARGAVSSAPTPDGSQCQVETLSRARFGSAARNITTQLKLAALKLFDHCAPSGCRRHKHLLRQASAGPSSPAPPIKLPISLVAPAPDVAASGSRERAAKGNAGKEILSNSLSASASEKGPFHIWSVSKSCHLERGAPMRFRKSNSLALCLLTL